MLEWLWDLRANAQFLVIAALFIAALRWGAAPERILSGAFLAMPLLDMAMHAMLGPAARADLVATGHLVLDVALFAAFGAVALYANRWYPLWLGAAQILAIAAHFLHATLFGTKELTYAIMGRVPSYIEVLVLVLGLYCHWRRTRRIGSAYPSWSS